jgi:phosphatidylinositol dimannoside acyltransferase
MAASTEGLITSQTALKCAVSIARVTPAWLGYAIGRWIARWLSSRTDSALVRAVRANQWVIAGKINSPRFLDQAVQAVFQNSARSIYELYHFNQRPRAADRMFSIDSSFQAILTRPEFDRAGLVLAGLHMLGFDLGLQWLSMAQFKPLVLTLPNPEGGRQMEFNTRQKAGIKMVPGSVKGLLQALHHLQQGGMVMTGIDHPTPESDPRPRFFGLPAALPTHYIYLALKAKVPVVVVGSRLEEDGKQHISASTPIEMNPYPNRADELQINAEKVLAVVEEFIRRDPQQWLISQPVWPEIIQDVPRVSQRTRGGAV